MKKMTWMVMVGLMAVVLAGSGCKNWKKQYSNCMAEKDNLDALFSSTQDALKQCEAERDDLSRRLGLAQNQLAAEQDKAKRQATGLEKMGGKYDASKGTITVTLANDVLFDSGKAVLKSSSKSRIARIADIIKREHPGKEVWVMGHTDTDPIRKSKKLWSDNWDLSTGRAHAVALYLIQQGLSPKEIVIAGRGQYHPISSDKAQNRRVEIIVYTR